VVKSSDKSFRTMPLRLQPRQIGLSLLSLIAWSKGAASKKYLNAYIRSGIYELAKRGSDEKLQTAMGGNGASNRLGGGGNPIGGSDRHGQFSG
jgi:hypothetical protein